MRSHLRIPLAFSLVVCGTLAPELRAADIVTLEREFLRPPDDARIMMRWWWFGPSVVEPQLEREMTLMKAGGIGGFEVQPVYPLALDDPRAGIKNLPFLSADFLKALTFTGARAKELGLRFDLTLGSGWPYGGPLFSIEEAAGRIRFQKVPVGQGSRNVPLPPLRAGERLITAFALAPATGDRPAPAQPLSIRDQSAELPASGPGGQAPREILFCIAGHTGMKVKRAAVGAEGYVIDHYDPRVIETFLKEIAEPELKACAATPPYAVFCDSLEVAGEDWTGDFLAEFQRRRGYDLFPHLPDLAGGDGPRELDIRHDWGRTLTELFNDRFLKVLQAWSHDHATRFRIQGYGTPPAALSSYAYADLNEAEGYLWKEFEETRWASSASHLLGRPVTSSETWTWLHSPVFRATPLDMKAEADLHFLQGVNQLIGHGWPYTPPGVEAPGWRFYAAGVFNEQNPWWIVMPDVAAYLQRVSFLLRQGRPANDVALYLSNSDTWAHFTPGRVSMNATVGGLLGRDVVRQVLEAGYNLDFFDDPLLTSRGMVAAPASGPSREGALGFGDLRYRVVILPGVERMPLETLQTLARFARSGGVLIATRRLPDRAPGFLATDADHRAVHDLAQSLFTGPNAPGVFVASEAGLGAALQQRFLPDVQFTPAAPDLGFVHRTVDGGELYFVANTSNQPQHVRAAFRVSGLQPELWDPLSGRVTPASLTESSTGTSSVVLDLEPYGSQVVVFSQRANPQRNPATLASAPAPLDLSSDWSVRFGTEDSAAEWKSLRSWTDLDSRKHFSGVATYRKRVVVPDEMLAPGLRVELDLGPVHAVAAPPMSRMQAHLETPVRDSAVVTVNGRRAGSLWCPPYRLDITALLQRGENLLQIEVANLAVNQMAARPLPDYTALKEKYGDRFQPQDMAQIAPMPSGLLGPIRLQAARRP